MTPVKSNPLNSRVLRLEFITIFKAIHEHTGSRSILSLVCRGIGLTLPITQLEKQISLRSAMLSSCLWGHKEDGPSHSEEEVSSPWLVLL